MDSELSINLLCVQTVWITLLVNNDIIVNSQCLKTSKLLALDSGVATDYHFDVHGIGKCCTEEEKQGEKVCSLKMTSLSQLLLTVGLY